MKTLILSDLHLGSRNCHAVEVREVLGRVNFDRLILNGDTINSVNLRKLTPEHWSVVDQLRQFARTRELILVRGNHDYEHSLPTNGNGQPPGFGPQDVLPLLLGVPMRENYQLEIAGRPYLVLHGDRFDPTLNYPLLSDVAEWCYQLSQKINKKLGKWLKKKSKRWGGILELVRSQSAAYARREGFVGVMTGHTHFADDTHIGGIHYVNSGCWTEPPCTYVTVEAERVRLEHLAH
jgi:UDP-2,3-diacylglucosamine pyrophosphatase LpxH